MKTTIQKALAVSAAIIISLALASCPLEPAETDAPFIQMIIGGTEANYHLEGGSGATIDWGNGIPEPAIYGFRQHKEGLTPGTVIRIEGAGLTYFWCGDAPILNLNTSNYPTLEELDCSHASLKYLDLTKNTALTNLDCFNNQLTALDVSKNTALTYLNCGMNQLTALDVSRNTALTDLICYDNQLTALDVSKNTALTYLSCGINQLTALDVSRNTALTLLSCDKNQLTALDVSRNTALTLLRCYDNQLTALDVSKNTALTTLFCYNNQMDAPALNALFGTLHSNTLPSKRVYCNDNPGYADCDKTIATAKGWAVDNTP